jgi:hypothetical protein
MKQSAHLITPSNPELKAAVEDLHVERVACYLVYHVLSKPSIALIKS